MAGMFYSLQEVAEKLNKTEQEVKQIVKDGRLREFRDGPNLLFKVDEVEALMSDTTVLASQEPSVPLEEPKPDMDEISLAPEPIDSTTAEGELTGADTAMVGGETDALDILGETDSDPQIAEDTLGETKAASGETALVSSDEASLEEIEEDVNLDTFGSGSGLLDLSLQADDTSLGGILDEIYTPEGGEDQETAEASAMEVGAEAEQMLSEELAGPQSSLGTAAMVQAQVEIAPDTLSNAFGIMLFLPLLAIVYTAIVAVAGFNNVMPAILEEIQGIIWYLVGGVAAIAMLIVGAAFMLSGQSTTVGKKQKTKKQKAKKAPQPTPEP